MSKRWSIKEHDAERISALAGTANISPVVAQLLVSRGITDLTQVHEFLDVKLTGLRDPADLPGVGEATECIFAAIQAEQRIVIYGDYDADGMTATAILYRCLKVLGANVDYYVPSRLDDGYGLNDGALEKLASQETAVVITVDCGIASVHEAETAKNLGLQLIITDHHQFADQLPAATAIVHPSLPGHDYPFTGLCGAGVALKLAWALCQRASDAKRVTERMRNCLMTAVGIAAIGTVTDVVPLLDENRILVRHGLNCLTNFPAPGIEALMKITELDKKPRLRCDDIGFTIGPRLNAAGRLGQAQLGVELLTTDSPERAKVLAEYLHSLNSDRDTLQRSIQKAAIKQAEEEFDPEKDPALVLAGHGWHPGVIGIVAGRLAEKYHRPVIVVALDQMKLKPGTGSGRSAAGLNLHQALAACSRHLIRHGGHAAAAGLTIEESSLDAFRADFCEYAAEQVNPVEQVPEVTIDAESQLSELTLQTLEQIEQLAPFGASNPRPILCASEVKAVGPKRMGGGGRHLTVSFQQHGVKLRAVAFGQGDWVEELDQLSGPIDIAYRPVINEFRGRRTVEMHLVDWRPAQLPATVADD